jgi:hypothetical protein
MADIEIGTAAFDTVTKGVASYLPYVTGLCYAIASIICLAGALEIYFAYINEAPRCQEAPPSPVSSSWHLPMAYRPSSD